MHAINAQAIVGKDQRITSKKIKKSKSLEVTFKNWASTL